MEYSRNLPYQRNENLEILLDRINGILEKAEDGLLEDYRMPEYPVIIVVGCARAGSTLLMQWLANTGKFAYPTNLLSRFYSAPYIGALIQQMLTAQEYSFRNEFYNFTKIVPYSSDLGKTEGTLAPNEFWYFWRRFFKYGEIQYLDDTSLREVDGAKFAMELAALEAAFGKPLALKGHIINWNIPFVSGLLEKVLFLYIKRHPLYNIQSLFEARMKYYGNPTAWYSFKPKEYDKLKSLNPYTQVAGQVYYTNRAIEEGIAQISPERSLQINYEEFCLEPCKYFSQIVEKFALQGIDFDWEYNGPPKFISTNLVRLPKEEWEKISKAYQPFTDKEII